MKELVEFIARSLVDTPDAVKVTEIETDQMTTYEIEVDQPDIGKLIGRQGRIVKAIRSVVRAAAARQGKRVAVEVV
ncbi:MAG TPA: KH domain-containing protein [Chloroflexota bacterium]|nr:KH domain-containing protein [Chloroflexota bacterium]